MSSRRTYRLIGRIIKAFFILLIVAVNALLIWRVFFSARIPSAVKGLAANDTLRAAYAENGSDLVLQYQDQASITRAENNAGYFSVVQCVFIPQANQVQVVFRYNNSTLKHLAEDYGLPETPSRDLTLFDVSLVRTTDLTPDNPDDNQDPATLSSERFFPSADVTRKQTALYTFIRYTFDGVTVLPDTDGVFFDVYYNEQIDYSASAYGTLCLYDCRDRWLTYKLSSADKQALK